MPLPPAELDQARWQFGNRVRELRTDAGLTQEELAHRAGLSRKTVSRVEVGTYSPRLYHVFELAHALGRPTVDLFQAER